MSKLIEQNQPKKSRFLKYSLFASISVGAIIAMPFEGMASNGSTESLVSLSEEDHSNSIKNDNVINILKNRPKSFGASNNKRKRPPARSKTFVGSEKIEQSQDTYTSEPTAQTLQKPEIIITASSSTVSPASNSFATASTIQNTTLLSAPQSPEHIYQNTPPSTTVSSPSTSYQPTPKSKPNDGVRANTSQKPKVARKILFSEPQQTVQFSKPAAPPKPIVSVQFSTKRISTEVAAKMVNNISRVNETIGIKLAEVESAIKNTQGRENKKSLQKLHKQLTSSQKTIETLKSKAEEIEKKIRILSDKNNNLADLSKGARLKNDQERMVYKIKICKNENKVKKLEEELTSKNNEADELSQKIYISVNKVVLTEPQDKAPVTEIPKAGIFLNQQQQLDVFAQQQRVDAARQAEVSRKKAGADKVRKNSARYKDLINGNKGAQLEQNQQHVAVEKTKKQQQAGNKQRSGGEKEKKEENQRKEKARDIVNIREDIVAKMQQILNTGTTLQITLHKLQELKAEAIEDKKKKQEARKLLSEIKKQEKAIKTAADQAQGILKKAEEETSRTGIQKLQTKMNGYYETVTNGKIAVDIQNLERLFLTPSTTSSATTIPTYQNQQQPKVEPVIPLTPEVQKILNNQENDGYEVPIQGKQQTYTTSLSTDPKSMDSGFASRASDTGFSSNHNSNKAYNFEEKSEVLQTATTDESLRSKKNWKYSAPYSSSSEFDKKQLEYLDLADNISTQNPKQSDILEALDLITPKQKTTAAKSDSFRKSNVSGGIPEIQQSQSEKIHTETLDMQNDLGLDSHSQEGCFDSGFFRSLESQNLSSAYDFEPPASCSAAYNQRMNTNAKDAPQETLTENSASSEKKQGSVVKGAVSEVGSILQTNDAENRERKRDGETSKQSTVDQEVGFGQDLGNEYHKESGLSIDSRLIKKATHLISLLDAKRTEIQQTTSPLQQKSLNSALREIENDYQEAIKISQELQQRLIHKPENAKAYNAKAEKKLDDIKNRADKHFNNIETDADVGFNPNWGKGTYYTQIGKELSFELSALKAFGYQNNINQILSDVARADSIKRPILFQNLLKDLEKRNQEAEEVAKQAMLDAKNNPDDNKAREQVALLDELLYNYNKDIKLVKKASEDNKEKNRENNNVRKPLEYLDLALKAKLAPLREYDDLDEDFKKVTASKKDAEAEYHASRNQNPNTDSDNDPELTKSATKHADLEKEQLQLEQEMKPSMEGHTSYLFDDEVYSSPNRSGFSRPQDTDAIYAAFDSPNNGNNYSAEDKPVFSRSSSVSISSILSDAGSNLPRSSSVSSLNNSSSPNIMELGELESKHEKIANDYKAKELELDTLKQDDPKFEELMLEVFKMSKDKIWLEGEIKRLDTESKSEEAESKSVFSRSSSVSISSILSDAGSNLPRSSSVNSLNSLSSDKDLSCDNTGDIGVGHRYGAEDSCSTPDQSCSKTANISNKNPNEVKLALLRTYQMAVTVKRQELEQLPSTSSGANQNAQQIKKLKEEEVTMHDAINACITDPSKLNDVSLEEINEALKKLSSGIPESIINVFGSRTQKDPEDLASSGKSESTLPTEGEESEDKEVTDVSRELPLLPVSSNDCALPLGDGSKDEEGDEGYNSGFEEEEGTIEQLSDSDGSNPETTAIDKAISLEQKANKEMQTQISENAPTLNQAKVVNSIVNNMIRSRLDASINMSNNMVAVGAGDEEEVRIKRGLWVRGMYGINNHGRVENINGYRGANKGATIGFDVEIDNNIVGIAYSNVHSVFKFKNNKNNDKEIIDSHVVSIYGQKELPKDFALQALVSASKNFIKDKTTYSYGDNKIRSNIKHRNHSYNAEALLNYNYLVKNNLVITPNIGLRYGKSRDGVYNETGINVQEIALTMKENNILSGIVGTKVKVPLKDALKFNNSGLTFQGAVEHNFKEKTQKINRVVKIFDTEFKQNYAIPKQPKTSYNLGTGIMGSIKNTIISLDYNYYLNKHYRSHQGSVKLKVNL
ncbi:autotransporter outer membrane beta-barrel domain-containing protein [Rickettsia endosymbiont of Cantharis rufa]|uniref:autotransporter outer membrane beta-barrel domain-containing protein n=1 Tax=Rickettsia endosymbiont of Cantharis rufa TaxID=3066248 RepID=UPI0031333474